MICRKMRPAAMMKTPDPTLMSMAVRCSERRNRERF
jgi:hypothetical protein